MQRLKLANIEPGILYRFAVFVLVIVEKTIHLIRLKHFTTESWYE